MAEHIGELVRGAVRAVPGADGAELWALAFQTLLGLELPLQGLARELEAALAALPKGPLEVSCPCIRIQGMTTFLNLESGCGMSVHSGAGAAAVGPGGRTAGRAGCPA